LQFQPKDEESPPQLLSTAEFAALGDPLFNLLRKDKANTGALSEVMATIQPNVANHRLFVVNEHTVSSTPVGDRRAALACDSANVGEVLKGDVMLSALFTPPGFQVVIAIDA
jgi:hypothetical protein